MAINYDPAAHGGAAFGDQDYDHLKSQGHSDSEINNYIGSLGTTSVSNKYKDRGGHVENDDSWKHYDDSWNGFIAAPEPTKAQKKAQKQADARIAETAKKKADEEAAAKAKFDKDQEYIGGLAADKKGPGGGIDYSDKYDTSSPNFHSSYKSLMGNYDPASRGGAAFGNEDYDYLKSQGHTDDSINKYISELDNSQVSNKYKTRGGFTPNESINSGKQSSEGLYQDKYSVGKNSADDIGDDYVSQGSLGDMRNYYFSGTDPDRKPGEYDFEKGYANWTAEGGYAGDVLKWYDSGQSGMKLNDEQYNRMVNDSKNFDWQAKMSSDGTQAGRSHADFDASGMYDARIGGTMASQGNMNDVTGNSYADWTNPEYYSNASVDARNNRRQQTNDALNANINRGTVNASTYKQREMEEYKPEGYKYNPYGNDKESGSSGPVRPEDVTPITVNTDPASTGGSVNSAANFTSNFFKGYNPQSSQSYQGINMNDLQASYEKMGFNFDPNRFNYQGQ